MHAIQLRVTARPTPFSTALSWPQFADHVFIRRLTASSCSQSQSGTRALERKCIFFRFASSHLERSAFKTEHADNSWRCSSSTSDTVAHNVRDLNPSTAEFWHLEAAHTFLITLQRAGYFRCRFFFFLFSSRLNSSDGLEAVQPIQQQRAINSSIRNMRVSVSLLVQFIGSIDEDTASMCGLFEVFPKEKKHLQTSD